MKVQLTLSDYRKLNLTRAIEKATGMHFIGQALVTNPVNKVVTSHDLFEAGTAQSLYSVKSFDENTLSVELKPKSFDKVKNVEMVEI